VLYLAVAHHELERDVFILINMFIVILGLVMRAHVLISGHKRLVQHTPNLSESS